mgnify:CR=1 FL=1
MAEESLLGKRLPRKQAVEIVTGKPIYASDIMLPGMLYGKILRCPYAHAKIKRIDTNKAEALPGVYAVVTYKDCDVMLSEPDRKYILNRELTHDGEPVAAVAAVTEEIAEEALDLIEVEYEVLPFILTAEEAAKPDAPHAIEGVPNIIPAGKPTEIGWGDVDEALKKAGVTVEGKYYVANAPIDALEPKVTVAMWSGDCLYVWTGTQGTFRLRSFLAKAFKISETKIRVNPGGNIRMGGGFGGKNYNKIDTFIAALLAKKAGRPVRLQNSREDEHLWGNTRNAHTYYLKSGATKDGKLIGLDWKCYAYSGPLFSDALGTFFVAFSYGTDFWRIPNLRFVGYPTYNNGPNGGAYRGYGAMQANWLFGIHFDELAEKLGMDPTEFVKKNVIKEGEIPPNQKVPAVAIGIRECIDKGAEVFGWKKKWKGWGTPTEVRGPKRRGVGFAVAVHDDGWYGNSVATVEIEYDGTITVRTGSQDMGQGLDAAICQIVAETLKVKYDDVSIVYGDTAATPYSTPSVASSRTLMSGNAVKRAAEMCLEQLFEAAAKILKTSKENLEAKDGYIYVKGEEEKKLSYAEIVQSDKVLGYSIIGVGAEDVERERGHISYGLTANFVELEVDTDTGKVDIIKVVAAWDVGRVINLMTLENQVEGGISSQGIGEALTEDTILDKNTGLLLNGNLLFSPIPVIGTVPEMENIFVETMLPSGEYGQKGCSEIALNAIGPAVSNAIYNAIGVRIREFPITPDKILKALGKG